MVVRLKEQTPEQIGTFLLNKAERPILLMGPASWLPTDGLSSKRWRFVAGTIDAANNVHFYEITLNDESDRKIVFGTILKRLPKMQIHDFDDEFDMIKFCEKAWPSDKIIALRIRMEEERKQWPK